MWFTSRITACFLIAIIAAFIPLRFHETKSCKSCNIPGISFYLTPDYGIAAARLPNGSSVAIAKIEGNQAYKTFMRHEEFVPWPKELMPLLPTCPSPSLVDKWLWGYLDNCPEADVAAVGPLLRGLEAAVESYLGNTICFVDTASPLGAKKYWHQQSIINEGLHQIGLTKASGISWSPGKLAMVSHGMQKPSEDQKLVLVIDNSHYGYNLGIFLVEDYGLIIDLQRHHHIHSESGEPSRSSPSLQHALEELLEPPFGPFLGEDIPNHIEEVVLHGDNILDIEFGKALEAVLDAQLISKAHRHQPVDAAVLGLAEETFRIVNRPFFETRRKAPFGCCWKSKEKGCPRE
ncbi:putative heat shock protein 70 protein [Fusarium austroafricanum]|uniref:Putative heat shock protein 70 protein n=1 Tax=Fusarium austroafricanum TaxID=2364996 RepID=A0A8H4KIP9_9HYPO|nr:putative heat shock protein 70 protein [Fusarium austroafricanum]